MVQWCGVRRMSSGDGAVWPLPVSVVARYIGGIPGCFAYVLLRHRRGIGFDQRLRQRGEGESQLTNPFVFLRRRYGKLYSDYKPEFCYWKLLLMGRKFLFASIIGAWPVFVCSCATARNRGVTPAAPSC
jgi:hypothetical protein